MILQISRIQNRRGLYENLPQLASGELGWAIDIRKLFVGNGTLSEGAPTLGNTEVLTTFSNIVDLPRALVYEGRDAVHDITTGPNILTPAYRTMQDKFDDIVNLRDFHYGNLIYLGDGLLHGTNLTPADVTATENPVNVINRAITQLYKASMLSTESRVRKVLVIPAGTYLLYGDFIRMMPYVTLRGEGKNSTFIVQTDSTQPCAISSCDSALTTGFAYTTSANVVVTATTIGANAAIMPGKNVIDGITFISNTNGKEAVHLDAVSDVIFSSSAMKGTRPINSTTNIASTSSVKFGQQLLSSNVIFANCDFADNDFALTGTDNLSHIVVTGGSFNNLYRGTNISTLGAVSSIRVTGVLCDKITAQAIYAPNVSNVVSAFNTFKDVGNTTPTKTTIVDLSGDSCYSIGDVFDRLFNDAVPAISLNGKANFATLANGRLLLGTQLSSPGYAVILPDNTLTITTAGIIGSGSKATTINYSIMRSSIQRNGAMQIVNDGVNIIYTDDYTQTAETGVILTPVLTAGVIELRYTTDARAISATLNVSSKTLI